MRTDANNGAVNSFETDTLEGAALLAERVEPWGEPVDGQELLEELAGVMRRFVVLPPHAAETLALWVVHTYAFELRQVSTYVGLESPEKRCGKTTLLSVLSELVNRPVVAANISPPALFRVIEETRPTLLIDEGDTLLQGNDELRGILNSGYSRKTAFVVRVGMGPAQRKTDLVQRGAARQSRKSESRSPKSETNPKGAQKGEKEGAQNSSQLASNLEDDSATDHKNRVEENGVQTGSAEPSNGVGLIRSGLEWGGPRLARFSCWCPKVIAAIGRLPETLADRCIVIRMQRKTMQDECERLRNLEGLELRRRCARFVQDHAKEIAENRPELPGTLNDRAADIWEPLLVLADLTGGAWGTKAREAAVALTARSEDASPIGSLLLDIVMFFLGSGGQDRALSREIVEYLNGCEGKPWGEARRGKGATDSWLAAQLRPYGIRPRLLRKDGLVGRGYLQEDFFEVSRRYVPRAEAEELRRSLVEVWGEEGRGD